MTNLKPTAITANRGSREITIAWNDGHLSIYPFALLRYACPCAECRGGHANMSADPDPAVFDLPLDDTDAPAFRLTGLEQVGDYALTPAWEDGHHFGIYTWRYLRALCPCPICRPNG